MRRARAAEPGGRSEEAGRRTSQRAREGRARGREHRLLSSNSGLPFLLVAFSLALVLLGLALTPAWAVPWRRGARALEERREELGVMGATGVVATVVFFLLIELTK